MLSMLINILIIFASSTWIQAVHTWHSRHSINTLRGISLTTLVIILFSEILWISYSLSHNLVGGVLNAVVSIISVGIIALILCNKNLLDGKRIVSYLGAGVLFFILLHFLPPVIVSIAATVFSTIFLIPQTIKTVNSIGSPRIQGMNNYSIAIIIIANSIWIIYGIYHTAYAYIVASTVLFLCGIIMAVCKVIHRNQQKKAIPPRRTQSKRAKGAPAFEV